MYVWPEGIHRAAAIWLAARVEGRTWSYLLEGEDIRIRSGQATTDTHERTGTKITMSLPPAGRLMQ